MKTKAMRGAISLAVVLLFAGALTACGEYSPVAEEATQDIDTNVDETDDDGEDVSPTDEETDADSPGDDDSVEPSEPPADAAPAEPDDSRRSGSGGTGGSGGSGGGSTGSAGSTGSGGNPAPPPDDDDDDDPIPVTYSFSLPPTDTSVTGNDGPAYGALRADCYNAVTFLLATDESFMWQFNTPRYTVFFVAGLAHCVGRTDLGNAYYAGAIDRYGTQGLDRIDLDPVTFDPLDPQPVPLGWGEPVCDLFRTLKSVHDQIPIANISCAAPGTTENFTYVFQNADIVFDDPCTFDVDESLLTWTGPDAAPTSFCGPITTESLTAAEADLDTLFDGWTVGPGGEIVPPPAAFATLAAPAARPEDDAVVQLAATAAVPEEPEAAGAEASEPPPAVTDQSEPQQSEPVAPVEQAPAEPALGEPPAASTPTESDPTESETDAEQPGADDTDAAAAPANEPAEGE